MVRFVLAVESIKSTNLLNSSFEKSKGTHFQEVLKEIVEQKFLRLANHLYDCDIDLTTITLNWFLALFFDAVPFQVGTTYTFIDTYT